VCLVPIREWFTDIVLVVLMPEIGTYIPVDVKNMARIIQALRIVG
jgi:hypothetical protein